MIVVAIIAILAAIAVPNFLEAQVRAKVSRVKTDLRIVKTGIGCYCVDNNMEPYVNTKNPYSLPGGQSGPDCYAMGLTSPVAYLSSTPADPFKEPASDDFMLRSIPHRRAIGIGLPSIVVSNPGVVKINRHGSG